MGLENINNIWNFIIRKSNRIKSLKNKDVFNVGRKDSTSFNGFGSKGILYEDLINQIKKDSAVALDLESVLAEGNTTADGQTIEAASGGGQLDLRYSGNDDEVMLSTDKGQYLDNFFYQSPGYTEMLSTAGLFLYGNDYNAGYIITSSHSRDIEIYGENGFKIKNNKEFVGVGTQDAEMSLEHDSIINIGENTPLTKIGLGTSIEIGTETIVVNGITKSILLDGGLTIKQLPIYADNAAAIAGGLAEDRVYKTATGELRIVV